MFYDIYIGRVIEMDNKQTYKVQPDTFIRQGLTTTCNYYECPNCKESIKDNQNYCDSCGVKLDNSLVR
jgi:predicted amidophosphoribosyltransferase